MDRTSTIFYLIKTLSNRNISEIHTLESLFDSEDEGLEKVFEYLDNLKADVREEIVQKLIDFAKEYREKISERENVKMN